jgi:predicted glycosyltransferase involved in capsule biosynthesis
MITVTFKVEETTNANLINLRHVVGRKVNHNLGHTNYLWGQYTYTRELGSMATRSVHVVKL